MMRPSIEDIKTVIDDDSIKHAVRADSLQVNIQPRVLSAEDHGFHHMAWCLCGYEFKAVTQHSAKTPGGYQEFGMALAGLLADHMKTAMATTIYQLHEIPS